jgi:FkbM family methyltransferase
MRSGPTRRALSCPALAASGMGRPTEGARAMSTLMKAYSDLRAIGDVCGMGTAFTYLCGMAVRFPEIVRSRNLRPADQWMQTGNWCFHLQGVAIDLEGRLFSGAREMYCRQVYFPSAEFELRAGTVVMDLGANTGLFSVLAGRVGCRVIAVEAQRGFVRELKELASVLGVAAQISVENVLIGARTGTLSKSSALASASHAEGFVPPLMSMDDLFSKHQIDQLDFLKVDIEGSEFDVFRADAEWLNKVNRIAMEVHPEYGSASELQAALESSGMSVQLRDNDLYPVSELSALGGYLFANRGFGDREGISI